MHATATLTLLTAEDLLALPDDGVRRELYRGELREEPMTTRHPKHAVALGKLTYLLFGWLFSTPNAKGEFLVGDGRVRLGTNPDTIVGIDIAYFATEVTTKMLPGTSWIDESPVLAVEILSPSDKHEDVVRKVKTYLDAGVAQVWIVDPDFQTVQVHRRGGAIDQYSRGMELKGEPDLPGFRAAVADFFVAKT